MASSFTDARKRQLARLDGAKPPTARAAAADDFGGQARAGHAGLISLAYVTAHCSFWVLLAPCGAPNWLVSTWDTDGLQLLTERSKTDAEGEGAEIAIPRDRVDDTCRWQT